MKALFVYESYIVGQDNRIRKDYRRKVKLRETKTMWITESGERFSKKWLTTPGTDWPMYCLESEPTLISTEGDK